MYHSLTARLAARMQALRATRERGATAVEYALMVSLIAVAIIVAVIALGGRVSNTFSNVTNSLTG